MNHSTLCATSPWRADFPLFTTSEAGQSLAYLDTAASAQKPAVVIEAMNDYYRYHHANVHRGVYRLSAAATAAYEQARVTVQQFLNAATREEIIFTRGTTESINLVAASWGQTYLQPGDEIIISAMEHHANIVPWQVLCQQRGAVLKVIPLMPNQFELDPSAYADLLSDRTRLVALTHRSNVLGTLNPVKAMIQQAHAVGAKVLIDGAQAVLHQAVDVQDLDCDFYVFSGHKAYGPTGIGVLYGRQALLEAMPPYQTGGGMIARVSFTHTEYAPLPDKFEAGTPAIAEAIGLTAAVNYLTQIGFSAIHDYETTLQTYAAQQLATVPSLKLISAPGDSGGIFSFVMTQVHPHDIATVLDTQGIAVRAGHHCTMPLHQLLQLPATVRASFGLYNDCNEVDRLVAGLWRAYELFN